MYKKILCGIAVSTLTLVTVACLKGKKKRKNHAQLKHDSLKMRQIAKKSGNCCHYYCDPYYTEPEKDKEDWMYWF